MKLGLSLVARPILSAASRINRDPHQKVRFANMAASPPLEAREHLVRETVVFLYNRVIQPCINIAQRFRKAP